MRPTLLEFHGFKFHAYPAMLAIAFLTCVLLTVRDINRRDPSLNASPQGGLWVFLGSLIGAKVYWILQYSEPKYLWHAFLVWEGGLVFYGGLIGGVAALTAYLKIHKLPYLIVADSAAPYVALGEAITRIGCFLNGCCWGQVTSVPWAVSFPRFSLAFQDQVEHHQIDTTALAAAPVHPTQLYMTVGLVLVCLALKGWSARPHRDGVIVVGYFLGYGVLRFTVEAFRADSAQSVFGMTVSQAISLAMAVVALAALIALAAQAKRHKPQGEGETPVEPQGEALPERPDPPQS